jgi:hypothetical protein
MTSESAEQFPKHESSTTATDPGIAIEISDKHLKNADFPNREKWDLDPNSISETEALESKSRV